MSTNPQDESEPTVLNLLNSDIKLDMMFDRKFPNDDDDDDDVFSDDDDSCSSADENTLSSELSGLKITGNEYDGSESFTTIAESMVSIYDDGKIKKRFLWAVPNTGNDGDALEPYYLPHHAHVTIQYKVFTEYASQPFDSSYAHRRPCRFTTSNGEVLPGLDLAVQSMRLNEKAQFLIAAEYAYRNSGSIGRVPPGATVLFEIELVALADTGGVLSYAELPWQQQQQFKQVYKYAQALCEQAKGYFNSEDYLKAVKHYNIALSKLEECSFTFEDTEDKVHYRELMSRLLTNIVVCYAKNKQYRKACASAEKLYKFTLNGEIQKVPCKVYFNHGKCLFKLGEFTEAKTQLKRALQLEPNNCEIATELVTVEDALKKHFEIEKRLAKTYFEQK